METPHSLLYKGQTDDKCQQYENPDKIFKNGFLLFKVNF